MKRAFPIVLSAMLAGCGVFQGSGNFADGRTAPGRTAGIGEKPETAGPEGGAGAAKDWVHDLQRLASVPRPKKKPSSIAAIRPDALVGLTPNEVAALIGRPASTTDQPPATVWLYRTNHCALEVFFYMDVGSKTFRALTFNLRSPDGKTASPSHCLRQIRAVAYGS